MDKKLYSIIDIYGITVKAFRSIRHLIKGKRKGLMDDKFQERIMLAVTAVNKCPMCTYAHTEMALNAGLSEEEIRSFVSGDFPDIPQEQVKAVLFAQHYADRRGVPKSEMWEGIELYYRRERAYAILAAIRIIMLGNVTGIIIGSLRNRIKRQKPDPRSCFGYELAFIVCILPILAIGLLHALIYDLLNIPYDKF